MSAKILTRQWMSTDSKLGRRIESLLTKKSRGEMSQFSRENKMVARQLPVLEFTKLPLEWFVGLPDFPKVVARNSNIYEDGLPLCFIEDSFV